MLNETKSLLFVEIDLVAREWSILVNVPCVFRKEVNSLFSVWLYIWSSGQAY